MPRKGLISLLVASVLVVSAAAQTSGGGKLFVLQSEDVQKELKLSDEQVAKLKELAEKGRNALKNLPGDRDERLKRLQEIQKENRERETQAADLLKPEQSKRLDQLMWQQSGSRALLSAKMIAELKITDAQKTRIAEVIAAENKDRQSVLPAGKIDAADIQDRLSAHRAKWLEKAAAVLTPEQQKQWQEKIGEPFKGKLISLTGATIRK